MVNNIPEEMMPETFIVPITVPPVTYAKIIIQGDNITIEPRLKTNADRIRAMTDEKLAKYLAWLEDPQACYVWELYENTNTIEDWLEWLKQECES